MNVDFTCVLAALFAYLMSFCTITVVCFGLLAYTQGIQGYKDG